MLITEELFLLLRRDDGKAENAWVQAGYGLSAAVLTDLILAGRLQLDDDKDPRVSVVDRQLTGHPVLDDALARVVDREGKKLSALVTDGQLDPEAGAAAALAERGVVGIEGKRMLGLVPARYPVHDPAPEREVRERLRTVLAGGTPRVEDSTLLSILQGLDLVRTVLRDEVGDLSKKDLRARIEEVSHEAAAGLAVGRAVATMNLAMMTALAVPIVVTGGS